MPCFDREYYEKRSDSGDQDAMPMAIVISCHEPVESVLFQTITRLSRDKLVRVYVIDSSPDSKAEHIRKFISSLTKELPEKKINYFHVKSLGLAYKENFGIKKACDDNAQIIMLIDDDVYILDAFDAKEIIRFFCSMCGPLDLLVFPGNEEQLRSIGGRRLKVWGDSCFAFSKRLCPKARIREDLVIDQTDVEFSKRVVRNGGKICAYPFLIRKSLPIGRVKESKVVLPSWRIYLFTRNVLALSLEERNLTDFLWSLWSIVILSVNNINYYHRPLLTLHAVARGILDALARNMGVTPVLQKLSGNAFDNET
ncbi:MAG: hypothetical protein ACP5UU_05940 [Thermoprotei archaeon]